ncbi:MAG: hypothetical protein WBN10_14860 [Polyangiales bacterium]
MVGGGAGLRDAREKDPTVVGGGAGLRDARARPAMKKIRPWLAVGPGCAMRAQGRR